MSATQANTQSVPVLWQLESLITTRRCVGRWTTSAFPTSATRCFRAFHAWKAERLTGDTSTTPVLTLDGQSIGDSTRIIAALEERWPQPPLYPQDAARRQRALELEEFFDEELGPHIRRVGLSGAASPSGAGRATV